MRLRGKLKEMFHFQHVQALDAIQGIVCLARSGARSAACDQLSLGTAARGCSVADTCNTGHTFSFKSLSFILSEIHLSLVAY